MGYRLRDLDRDGRPEFVSADDRFAYVFTSFAESRFSIRIWRFDHGRLRDVTRHFPALIEAEAGELWPGYFQPRQRSFDPRGRLAAWAADLYLLGRGDEVWSRLEKAYRLGELGPRAGLGGWPQGQAYLRKLRAFLRKTGYG